MSEAIKDKVELVFNFWREVLSNARSQLDDKRRKAIAARLKDGYTVEDLQLACLGCKSSEFHNGHNDRHKRYVSIELICRDADHVDQFIEIAERESARELSRIAKKQEQPKEAEVQQRREMPAEARAKIDALLGRFRRTTQ